MEVLSLSPKEGRASVDLVTMLTSLPKLSRAWRRASMRLRRLGMHV